MTEQPTGTRIVPMAHTENPTSIRNHVPRLIADKLSWNESRTDLGFGFYRTLNTDLLKFGSESKRLERVGAVQGLHGGHEQEFIFLESPEVSYQRAAVFPFPVTKEGKMWTAHEVDQYEIPRIVVLYQESGGRPPLRAVTITSLGNVLDPDGKPYESPEDYKKIGEMLQDFSFRVANENQEVDQTTRKASSYPARVESGWFGTHGPDGLGEPYTSYEPL